VLTLAAALFGELRRRWPLALACFVAVFGAATTYALVAVPRFTSQGVVQVTTDGALLDGSLGALVGNAGRAAVETEVEIIKRRDFVVGVAKSLGFQLVDPAQPGSVTWDLRVASGSTTPVDPRLKQVRAAIARAEVVSGALRSFTVRLTQRGERIELEIADGGETVQASLAPGEPLVHPHIAFEFAALPFAGDDSFTVELLDDSRLAEASLARLRVEPLVFHGKTTDLVSIKVVDVDREDAAQLVDGLMAGYLAQSLSWKSASASQAAEFIEKRLTAARERLDAAESALKVFSEREQAVALDIQARAAIERLSELEAARSVLSLQVGGLAGLSQDVRRGKALAHAGAALVDDPVLLESVGQLAQAETALSTLRAGLEPAHPKLALLGDELRRRRGDVAARLKDAQTSAKAREAELGRQIDELTRSLEAFPGKELQLARLMRDVEVQGRVYSFLLEKLNDAEILRASTTTDKRIVDSGSIPARRSAPARAKLLVGGALAGLVFALAVVTIARLVRRQVGSVEEVEALLGLPTFGRVPTLPELVPTSDGRLRPHEIWRDRHGPLAEAFRSLAVSATMLGGRGHVIQVTSSGQAEGKSTVISNLAVALARSGKKVLLVDLDLRRPVQHRIWRVPRAPGFTDYLGKRDTLTLDDVVHDVGEHGIHFLSAGARMPDTLAAFMFDGLADIIEGWRKAYDVVLLDSSPAFVPDVAGLARHVDLTLLVVRPGVADRAGVLRAAEVARGAGCRAGVVFNAVERAHSDSYYGGRYYGQAYGYDDGPADGEDEAAEPVAKAPPADAARSRAS